LNDSLLPVRATPTSAKITTIRYGEKLSLTLKMLDGREECFTDNISEAAAQAGAKDGSRLGEVAALEVRMPSERLKEGVIIVDSPGLNDPEIERSNITTDYMDRCDCVLFFLNATQSWKRSEKEFIEERVLSKTHFNKIFFLMNFWDCIDEKERPSVLSYTKGQIAKSVQILRCNCQGETVEVKEPELVPVSAKTGENMGQLETTLWDYLADKRGANLVALKVRKIFGFIDAALERIGESIEVYQKERSEVEDDIVQLKSEVESFAKDVETFRADLYKRLAPAWQSYISGLEQLHTSLEEKICQSIHNAFRSLQALTDKGGIEKLIANRTKLVIHQHKARFQALERELIDTCGRLIQTMKGELNLRQTSLLDFTTGAVSVGVDDLLVDDHMGTLWCGVGGMVAVAVVLSSIFPPLAVLAPIVLVRSEKYRLNQLREELEAKIPELSSSVNAALADKREEIASMRQQVFDKIFENTRSEILELYQEKNDLLAMAINDKEKDSAQEALVRFEGSKIELLAIKDRLASLVKNG